MLRHPLFLLRKRFWSEYIFKKNEQSLFDLYGSMPRYTETLIKYKEFKFLVPDALSVAYQLPEIFEAECFKFNLNSDRPVIIDCGANVGTSSVYFAKAYPNAQIHSFEADENIYGYLVHNLTYNNVFTVNAYNKCVWTEDTIFDFFEEGADAGSVVSGHGSKKEVPAISFREFLQRFEKVDFLKMDIEGAEVDVLVSCGSTLNTVKNLFVEYHSYVGQTQKLDSLLKVLTDSGFKYSLHTISMLQKPFVNNKHDSIFDLQINISAYRI